MVLFLSENEVESLLSMPAAINIAQAAFLQQSAGNVTALPRVSQTLPGTAGAFRMIAAALPETSFFGLKTLTGLPGKRLKGEVYFVVLLFDMLSGALRAIVSANHLTGMRTGAASGVAARYLAREQASHLGVLGSGVQAWYQVQAISTVRAIKGVSVFSPRPEHALLFAERVQRELGFEAQAVSTGRAAVQDADLVIAATTASEPVVEARWLQPGTHITAVGANAPSKRELDTECFQRGRLVVDSRDQVLAETGDVLHALRSGHFPDGINATELSEVAGGGAAGRRFDEELTIFKSVGIALQDVAVAAFLYEQARQKQVGTWLDPYAPDTRLIAMT